MNIEEIDKWLDNEYGCSYTRLEELHDYFFEKYTDQKEEIERLNNIRNEAKDYIKSKSIKFTMAYVEDDGRIDLSRSDYRIDKLTSKQVKELLEILDKGSDKE